MPKPKIQRDVSTKLRFPRAYLTALVVLFSYLRLRLTGRVFGPAYVKARLPALHRRNAARVENTVLRLRGLFLKVGQLISIMTNFLPEEFRKPLERLQDQVPPRPVDQVRRRIEEELEKPVATIFATFDDEPLASASLGQVHRATLHDGTEVVIKVQHSDIDVIVASDLRTIWKIMALVRLFVPIRGLDTVYRQVRSMILAEIDFRREASFTRTIGENLRVLEGVSTPAVFEELSTSRVLTISYEAGFKVNRRQQLESLGINRCQLAQKLVRAYCHMIFVDGVYHADPHPGNLLVREDGTLVLLDFGAVAELSPSMKAGIPRFLEAVLRRDPARIHRELRSMGFIAHGSEAERASERIVEYLQQKLQDELHLDSLNLKDIRFDPQRGMENLIDLRRQDISLRELMNAFQVPKDWVMLERTLILIGGVCTELDPQMNPVGTLRPYLEEFVLGEGNDLTTMVVSALRDTGMSALALPADISATLRKLQRGEIEVQDRGSDERARLHYAGAHQIVYGMGIFATGVPGLLVLRNEQLAYESALLLSIASFCSLAFFWSRIRARHLLRKAKRPF